MQSNGCPCMSGMGFTSTLDPGDSLSNYTTVYPTAGYDSHGNPVQTSQPQVAGSTIIAGIPNMYLALGAAVLVLVLVAAKR